MTIESAPTGAATDELDSYRDVLAQVAKLVGDGDYESGVALLQKVARASGSEDLMRLLIELRVEAFPKLAD